MKWKMLSLLLFLNVHIYAQDFVRTIDLDLQNADVYIFNKEEPFDALCFESDNFDGLELYSTLFGRHSILPDLHHGEKKSQLFIFQKDKGSISIESKGFEGKLTVIFIRTGTVAVSNRSEKQFKNTNCDKPDVIPPSVWRSGLPQPKPIREYNNARHMIIHHSAGSNFNTNFTAVVRSIYLLHVESNGWDDIGYNYLVAANGNIFAGRDPLELIDEDEVRGAHFCSKNTGTMGTCILGTYTDTVPTALAVEALHRVLLWKLAKIHIGPADSFPHPGPSDPKLAVVAGHREGCNTECPGNRFFPQIATIRQNLENDWKLCPKIASLTTHVQTHKHPYPNPLRTSDLEWHLPGQESGYYTMLDCTGRMIAQGHFTEERIVFSQNFLPGIYLVKTKSGDQWHNYSLIKH